MNDVPAIVAIAQASRVVSKGCQSLLVTSTQIVSCWESDALARRLVAADLVLRSFYRVASRDPVLGAIVTSSKGLKPLPPPSLFEMAVIAITEQQISMAAAFQIRSRLIKHFGTPVDDLHVFPAPERPVHVLLCNLKMCGLPRRKAEYLKEGASRIASGTRATVSCTRSSVSAPVGVNL